MNKRFDSPTDGNRRLQIAVLAGIALGIALIIITLSIPRFTAKGPYQIPPKTGDG